MNFQIVVGVTKAVGERFGKGGIADRMIWFSGFPFLHNKEEHAIGVPVSQVMTSDMTVIPSSGLELKDVEQILSENKFQGFPIVQDRTSKILVGYIGRTELRYAIDRARRERHVPAHARCFFSSPPASSMTPASAGPPVTFDAIASASGLLSVDFIRFIDPTPLTVHPRLPLETVMEIFKKMGPRAILIEYHGRLTGLVTVKDCLKYQFKVEASENPRGDTALEESQERLWELMKGAAGWAALKVYQASGGRLKISALEQRMETAARSTGPFPTDRLQRDRIMDGTEDEDPGVELHDR
jgi:chloride channel 3/4/5